LQDTLFNAQRLSSTIEHESNRTTELVRQAAERERELQMLWRNGLLLLLALLVVAVLLNRYRLKRSSEAALKEFNRKLEDANTELVQLNREKDELLGIVAHDLKNPIAGIRSLTKLMVEHGSSISADRINSVSQMIQSTTERMLVLINNLLNVNAIEQGMKRFTSEEVYFPALVEDVVSEYEVRAAEKTITLHLELPEEPDGEPSADYVVWCDLLACRQIVDNLVSNAVKYSPLGKRVWVSVFKEQHHSQRSVILRVRDEGTGISPEDESRLFGKFARLQSHPTGGEQQTGLGLSIAKRLANEVGGNLRYERSTANAEHAQSADHASQPSNGATFVLSLPSPPTIQHPTIKRENKSATPEQ